MPTTNTSFSSLITAIDTRAQTLASNGEAKDLVYLGKAIEAMNIPDSVSAVIDEGTTQVSNVNTAGTTQVSNVQTEGATQVAAVQAAGSGYLTSTTANSTYAALSGATFTGAVTIPDLTVTGTTTSVNSTNLEVADANITVASGATTSAAADGAGITIDGAGVNFAWSDANQHMNLNKGLRLNHVKEAAYSNASTTGTLNVDAYVGSVWRLPSNMASNRAINFRADHLTTLDSVMAFNDSITFAIITTQGSSAYYLNTVQIDGTTVTPKWQGGGAPTAGNASGNDVYTFTIIKTAANTFLVLASQTQFA